MTDALLSEIAAIDPKLPALLDQRDSGPRVITQLSFRFPAATFFADGKAQRAWEVCGLYYLSRQRVYEALAVFRALYRAQVLAQDDKLYLHKATALVWISECFGMIGFPVHARRYLMLTLCEDAIQWKGTIPADTTGVYFRLVWNHGMSDADFQRYAADFWRLYQNNGPDRLYPESLLQEVDNRWQTVLPSPGEAFYYAVNDLYVRRLMSVLSDGSGLALERLAEYLLSCMPGCKTKRRVASGSSDYDIVCSMEGFDVDFRSELGRYFICECKDWSLPADFTTMAKFCRVLDSIKSKFGILFSSAGITGAGKTAYAEREQLKVYSDRGIVIVVLDSKDLQAIAAGANLIWLLREQYEAVRLDTRGLLANKTLE